jgi:hypothetical protein
MNYEQHKREILAELEGPWASDDLREAVRQAMLHAFAQYEARQASHMRED